MCPSSGPIPARRRPLEGGAGVNICAKADQFRAGQQKRKSICYNAITVPSAPRRTEQKYHKGLF